MPTKSETWYCKTCGAPFQEAGHARTCELLHIPLNSLRITEALSRDNFGHTYAQRSRTPDVLVVSDGQGHKATYVLVNQNSTSSSSRPHRKGGLKLKGPSE